MGRGTHGKSKRMGENRRVTTKSDGMCGAALGTDNIRLVLTLDRVAGTLTGTFMSQVKDTANTVLLTVTGDYAATPITV
ncbi:MAG: hypothetical protein AB7N91_27245 [Candidatus Tectimicrobiota bacterium]